MVRKLSLAWLDGSDRPAAVSRNPARSARPKRTMAIPDATSSPSSGSFLLAPTNRLITRAIRASPLIRATSSSSANPTGNRAACSLVRVAWLTLVSPREGRTSEM